MTISSTHTRKFIEKIEQGNLDQALSFANDVSRKDPENPLGYAMLGDALKQKGELEKAASFYQYSLQKAPDQPGLYVALGEAYVMNGDVAKAYNAYYQALSIAPSHPTILQKTGGFLVTVGQLQEAKILLQQSLALGNQAAIKNLLELVIYTGNAAEIEDFLDQYSGLLNNEKDDLAVARANFRLGRYAQVIDELSTKKTACKNDVWKAGYFNLLASTHEKLGDYATAFRHFKQQNQLQGVCYDAGAVEQHMHRIIEQCDSMPALSQEQSLKKFPAFSPLFIVGMPRSGTTLVEQILNTSSHVVPGGELHFIEAAFQKFIAHPQQGQAQLEELAKWYREKIEFITLNYPYPKTAPRWITDKMPTNFMYLGFIKKCLPDARFVHIQRGCMDNGLSIYKQNFMKSHAYASTFEGIAHFMSIEDQVMAHWKHLFPQSVYTLSYEGLVNDFERETRNLYQFAELSWSHKVHRFYQNKTFSNTASRDQVRQPLHNQSVGAYKRYKKQMAPFEAELKRLQLAPV